MATTTYRGRAADLLEDVSWLLSFGAHPQHVAGRLAVSPAAIEMVARRAGRADVATLFCNVRKGRP